MATTSRTKTSQKHVPWWVTGLALLLQSGVIANPASDVPLTEPRLRLSLRPPAGDRGLLAPSANEGAYLRGESLTLRLDVRSPANIQAFQRAHNAGVRDTQSRPLRIAVPGARWTDSVSVRISRMEGTGQVPALEGLDWRRGIRALHEPDTRIEEVGIDPVSVPIYLPPDVTSALQPGQYRLEAVFDNTRSPVGTVFRTRLPSEPWTFTIREATTPAERGWVLARQATNLESIAEDFPGAEKLAKLAVDLDPQNADAWYSLGRSSGMLKKPAEALAAFERLLALAEARSKGRSDDTVVWARRLVQGARKALERQ